MIIRPRAVASYVGLGLALVACGANGTRDATSPVAVATSTTTASTTTMPTILTTPPSSSTTAAPTTTTTTPVPSTTAASPDDPRQACGTPVDDWQATLYTTKRFEVTICESVRGPELWYRGRNVETGDRIDLPAEQADLGTFADNGEYQYYVNGDRLDVYQGEELILSEQVISVR